MTEETKTLDLAKVFKRDDVKMPDGTTFFLRNKAEFSVVADHRLRALIDQFTALDDSAVKTEEDAEKASQMLRDLATMLIVDPPEVIEDWACVAIFEFWMTRAEGEAPPNPPKRPQDRKPSTRKRTTAASSRASKRSTVATRKSGTKKSKGGR